MRPRSRDSRTQPVPSMSAWADGSASTANTASGAASIVVDAVTRSVSIPMRRLAGPERFAAERASAAPAIRDDLVAATSAIPATILHLLALVFLDAAATVSFSIFSGDAFTVIDAGLA